ncbi:Aminodeoxychorismate synthase component 1 [Cellulomonas sp. T2.31MG-18]|uniref:chorismate-binding protein n=1 Tax=Cellulomonas sp. T2.31MG-18 TaxID=3157619 RepID=UPI0035EAA02B
MLEPSATAWFGGVQANGVLEAVDLAQEPDALSRPGWWAVVGEFEGRVRAWRFADVHVGRATTVPQRPHGRWDGPAADAWSSSMGEAAYRAGVETIRTRIRGGEVYQVNLCRVLAAPLPAEPRGPDAAALGRRLVAGNPAPYQGGVQVGPTSDDPGVWVVSASPELFLSVDGGSISSGPIKGTAAHSAGLSPKDRAENVMITDLVRNDLQRVCLPGSVEVTTLLGEEQHPGLVHLVSTVTGRLDPEVARAADAYRQVLEATYPPGSVSGAPKSSALRLIRELEPVPRGPYCGTVGWVHVADDGSVRARLAVSIRTFWWSDGMLRFGTGAGITWGSDPAAEWAETELKAARLVGLASRRTT